MPKLPACDRCLFYAPSGIHPTGVEAAQCPDFAPAPDAEPEALWQPVRTSYYNGELIRHQPDLSITEQLD